MTILYLFIRYGTIFDIGLSVLSLFWSPATIVVSVSIYKFLYTADQNTEVILHSRKLFAATLTLYTSCKTVVFTCYIMDVGCSIAYAGKDFMFKPVLYISVIIILAFNCLRVWGITQHQWLPTLFVFVFSIFDPVINTVSLSLNPV